MMQPRNRAPALYRLAVRLNRRGIRGSWRLLRLLNSAGLLNRPVSFPLSQSIRVLVPIQRIPWDEFDLEHYESGLFGALERFIAPLAAPVTLIDGGADIGLFSLKMLALYPVIQRILAFEPNPDGFAWLQRNLAGLSIQSEAVPQALSDFSGLGKLEAPSAEIEKLAGFPMDYASYFLVPSADGSIPVTTVDSFSLPSGNLILKLDVEGGERAALRGAQRTVQAAEKIVIVLEAHPLVAKRTGIDPVECLRMLASWRPLRFVAAESGAGIALDRALFDQIPPTQVYNLICYHE